MPKHLNVHIRWMIRRDMLSVFEIEQGSFDFPMIEADIIKLLRQSHTIGMVAEDSNERIVGYMIYSLYKYSLDVNSLAVHPAFRLRGIGSQMVDKLASKLHYQRRNAINLVVEETNLGALHFFKKLGFVATGLVKQPYDEIDVDGITMRFMQKQEVAV